MIMKIRGKTYTGKSFAEMSETFCALRDKLDMTVSRFADVKITDDSGKQIARISYNGRVWNPGPWVSGAVPLYDNRGV